MDGYLPPDGPNFICASGGNGPGLNPNAPPAADGGPYTDYNTNVTVLSEAAAAIYPPNADIDEVFAEEVGYFGGGAFLPYDHYLTINNGFTCTQLTMQSELQYGAAPTPYGQTPPPNDPIVLPSTCPAK